MDKLKVLLMYSGVIDIPARDGKEALSGVSVEYYFFGNDGEMVEPRISADGVSGTRRGKVFMDAQMAGKVSYVPGIYDGTFEMNIGADGKPVLKLVDIDFVAKAGITAIQDTQPDQDAQPKKAK